MRRIRIDPDLMRKLDDLAEFPDYISDCELEDLDGGFCAIADAISDMRSPVADDGH